MRIHRVRIHRSLSGVRALLSREREREAIGVSWDCLLSKRPLQRFCSSTFKTSTWARSDCHGQVWESAHQQWPTRAEDALLHMTDFVGTSRQHLRRANCSIAGCFSGPSPLRESEQSNRRPQRANFDSLVMEQRLYNLNSDSPVISLGKTPCHSRIIMAVYSIFPRYTRVQPLRVPASTAQPTHT